jgi:hypothetical protein
MRNLHYTESIPFGLLLLGLSASLAAQDRPQFIWQGQVDGTAILHLAGKRLAVQIQDGAPVEGQKFHFSDALPQTQQQVRVEVLKGRGYVHAIDQPSIENNYTLAVSIEDRQPGSSFYSIALYWDASSNLFERGAEKTDHVAWAGRVDEDAVISCHKQNCVSTREHGAPVADEHFKFSRPLPESDTDVRLEDPSGRGDIRLIEQPRQRNNYTTRVSIRDPQAGAGEYSFALVWNRQSSRKGDASKEAAALPDPTGRGFLWSGRVDGQVRVTIEGGGSFSEVLKGAPVSAEHAESLRPLPPRADLIPSIQKLHGRGKVSIVELPSEKNNYRLVFEIDDPGPGADDYEVELDW